MISGKSEEDMTKQCYGSSVRKVVTAAILLLILEVNMIAIYTYNMVDHSDLKDTPRKEDIVVRVKRTVTESTLETIMNKVKINLISKGKIDNSAGDDVSSGDGQFPEDQAPEFYEKNSNKTSKVHSSRRHGASGPKKPPSTGRHQTLPAVYIIGAKTSGTETLRKLLNLHPQVVTACGIHYFVRDNVFRKGDTWYHNHLPNVRVKKEHPMKLVDVDEDMFTSISAIDRLKRKNPSAKLIVVLREPFERMLAEFLTIHKGIEGSGEQSYESYFVSTNGSSVNEHSLIVSHSMYDVHLKHWLLKFDFSHFLFIDYHQMLTQPYSIMKKVEKFLDVEPHFYRKGFIHLNKNKKSLCTRGETPRVCLTQDHPDMSLPSEIEGVLKTFFTQRMDNFWTLVSNDVSVSELVSLIN